MYVYSYGMQYCTVVLILSHAMDLLETKPPILKDRQYSGFKIIGMMKEILVFLYYYSTNYRHPVSRKPATAM